MEMRFPPRRSRGGLFLMGVFLIAPVVFFLLLLPFFRNPSDREGLVAMMILAPFLIAMIGIAVTFLIWFYKMSYVISEEEVLLSCGPIRMHIPLSTIQSVRVTDLKYDLSSTGFKIPGFSLFRILYAGDGWVRMCARAVCKEIVLLETTRGKFGLTPENPRRFLQVLDEQRSSIVPRA